MNIDGPLSLSDESKKKHEQTRLHTKKTEITGKKRPSYQRKLTTSQRPYTFVSLSRNNIQIQGNSPPRYPKRKEKKEEGINLQGSCASRLLNGFLLHAQVESNGYDLIRPISELNGFGCSPLNLIGQIENESPN